GDAALPPRASAPETASGSACPPETSTSTSASAACWPRAPRTFRSTPTIPTSAPGWSFPKPQSLPCSRRGRRSTCAATPACRSLRGRPASTTTPGSSSPPAPPASPRAWPCGTAAPPRSRTPRLGCSWPRSRSARATGYWLVAQEITAISTVPTLAALWPDDCLDEVRLLIFGGEACPPELAARLVTEEREVWNTYGPTEATVVATAARLDGAGPVRIGLPLDGWQLAVVDAAGSVVPMGECGELVIGGVGLARYLDQDKDTEKFAPLPALGWERAYRSGDLVRAEPEGLLFLGRADEQVKLGGRRIELGEVDAALQALPGVAAAAAAVRTARGGNQVLVGYLALSADQ